MHLSASLLQLGLSYGERAVLIGSSGLEYLISIMALHRIGAKAVLMGPGDLTSDKVNFLITKNLDCRLIAYDPENMTDSQAKQLMLAIKELVQHNADCGREPQVIISLHDRFNRNHNVTLIQEFQQVYGKSVYTHKGLVKHGQSHDLTKLLETQQKVQIDDAIVALFTSGSTGEPKVVQHTTHSLANFLTSSPIAKITSKIKLYRDRPFCWIAGYLFAHAPLLANITLIHVPTALSLSEPSNENIFKIWEEEKCSHCGLSSAIINKLLKDSMYLKYDLSHIENFTLAGQHFNLSSIKAIFKVLPGVKFNLVYGCTESPKFCSELVTQQKAVEGIYGKMAVAPGVEVKVVDDENRIVPQGTPGEICTRSFRVFLEYLENPEATRKAKSKTGWLHTGDIGCMDDQGKVEILGRKSTIIKRLAVKIFPSEIEKIIQQHPLVADIIVVGVPDQRLHEEVCACVVLCQEMNDATDDRTKLQELEEWSELQWPPRADGLSLKPKYFLSMKTFPVTVSGKTFVRGVRDEAIKQIGLTECK